MWKKCKTRSLQGECTIYSYRKRKTTCELGKRVEEYWRKRNGVRISRRVYAREASKETFATATPLDR